MHAAHGTWDTGSTPGVFIQQRGTKKHPPRKIQRHQADDNPRQVRTLSAARPHPVRSSNQRQVPSSDLQLFSFIVFLLGWQPTKRPPVVRGTLLSLHFLLYRARPQYRAISLCAWTDACTTTAHSLHTSRGYQFRSRQTFCERVRPSARAFTQHFLSSLFGLTRQSSAKVFLL